MSVVAPPPQDELELLIREARARQWRRRMVVGTVVAVLAGSGLAIYSATHGTVRNASHEKRTVRPVAAASCRADQLRITFVRKGAVMGEEGGLLRFTNIGSRTCSISGWPMVVAVTGAGSHARARTIAQAPMLYATAWLRWGRVPTLALRSGSSGYSILGGYDNPAASGRPASWRCPSARRLLVSPPEGHRPVSVSGFLWRSGADRVDLPLCGGKPFVTPIRARPGLAR
jgi:Protein of unknown function (DUF4232)